MSNVSNLRRGLFLVWLAATLLWAVATAFFVPVQDAVGALWQGAPTAEEMVSQQKAVDKAFSDCLAQPLAETENAAAASALHAMTCNMMKLSQMPAGLTSEVAWVRVSDYLTMAALGSLGIAAVLLLAAWAAKGARET
jgi:hypothetical protein